MYVTTHRVELGNQEALRIERALVEENDRIATQLSATDQTIDLCERSACGHRQRVDVKLTSSV